MSWKIGEAPKPFEVSHPEASYAVIIMMGGDGNMAPALMPDVKEMMKGASADVAVLLMIDTADQGLFVGEVLPGHYHLLETHPEISTGDPRPLADFLARALVSFSHETRIAIGFWGHGLGVFGDYDPAEVLIKREHRFGPLGAPLPDESSVTVSAEPMKKKLSRSMLPDSTSENSLTNREANSALTVSFSRAQRTEPVDMLFFDTCLSASVEMFAEFRRFAKTYVASALNIPGPGWNYFYWLKATQKESPKSAEDWAFLAVGTFGAEYDQRFPKAEPAQLWAFSTGSDFVKEFGRLVEELKSLGPDGVRLVRDSAQLSQCIHYGENLDFGQMLQQMGKLSKSESVRVAAAQCFERYEQSVIAKSMPPPKAENLTGVTLWCPIEGDREKVGVYYRELEFDRLSGWMSLLTTGAPTPVPEEKRHCEMFGFWNLKLEKAQEVEELGIGEGVLWLAIPESCREFSGGLVEGQYRFYSSGSIRFPTYVALREFVRKLLEMREGKEFEALRGVLTSGWVIGGQIAESMVADFDKYEERFVASADLPEDVLLYQQMRQVMKKVSEDGVLIFL